MNDCSQNLGPRLRYLNNRIMQYMDQQFLASFSTGCPGST